jgi:hypothetical protein
MVHVNVVAVRRVYAAEGREAAIIEILRRWPQITDPEASELFDRILSEIGSAAIDADQARLWRGFSGTWP